ncbi:MAG: L,D-transpeptidase family protein, partial [Rhodomicrobium sp.]
MRFTSVAAILCIAGFTAVAADGTSSANARQSRRGERQTQSRAAGAPLLAIIALAQQRVSVYGASGKIMEAPVSTGATGRETPAGIYSILEKE